MQIYLKEWRLYRKLKQKELAWRTGRTLQTISNIERGGPTTASTLRALAEVLECEESDLFHLPQARSLKLEEAIESGAACELRQLSEILRVLSQLVDRFPERVPDAVRFAEKAAGLPHM